MHKVWLEHYPDGVPTEVDLHAYSSVTDVLDQVNTIQPDAPAFSNFGTQLSYQQTREYSLTFAAYLQQVLGLQKGDRIALMMPNLLQYPIAMFGALYAGLVVVNVNPLYTGRELRHQLVDSGASTIVILENFAQVLAGIIDQTSVQNVIITRIGDHFSFPKSMLMNAAIKYLKKQVPPYRLHKAIQYQSIFKRNKRAAWSPVEVSQQDLAFLQYTGGTTGVAKGAMLTHGNMIANMQQACAWISPNLTFGKEVIITALPLYHIFALTANCLTFAKFGALNYLITNPRDLKGFVKELNSVAFTAMTGVNTLFNGLLHTPGFKSLDFSHFKMTLGGGMAVQQVVANQWQEVTGVTLVEAYGLTETSPAVCMNPMNLSAYNGSIGLPIPMTDCRVCDDQDNILAIGEAGELQVHGPQVMLGYWNKEEETKKVFTQDGWLRTGDIATMDEQGYLRIVDRKKDMILVSGFNVYPNEVEAVIAEHPMVLEVGVIGVDDAKTTEAVMAVVVRKDPALTVAQLRTFCKTQLTGYKVPKHIEFRNEIPKTNVGKILRRALRDSITQQ